jgi:hypothetical protein
MPFSLEKGVLGLRMDYLIRSPAVRANVLQRLQDGQDPFAVQANIVIPGVEPINVFTDKKADFARKLDQLVDADPTHPDPHHGRSGAEYVRDQWQLRPANNDGTGNRRAFAKYWEDRRQQLSEQIRLELIAALSSHHEKLFFWWECTLPHGESPRAEFRSSETAGHVYFLTDHGPAEPPDTRPRRPEDPDPGQAIQG